MVNSFGVCRELLWPFAKVRISPTRIRLAAKFWRILDVSFVFEKAELQALRKRNGLINAGLQFQHEKANYPSLLIFWTLSPEVLFAELQRMGYDVSEASD